MTTYTPSQIRSAILRTAELFEREPGMFMFHNCDIPGCGTPACALGWIGAYLGIRAGEGIFLASEAMGHADTGRFYSDMWTISPSGWRTTPQVLVKNLRAYADKFYPEQQLDPAFVKLRASLPSLAAQARLDGKFLLAAVIEQDGAA